MLGIDPVVAAPVPVACVNVDAFVNSLRFAPRDKCKFRRKDQQQQRGQRQTGLGCRKSLSGSKLLSSAVTRGGILALIENWLGASRPISVRVAPD
jgi:hypothetical protein